MPATTEINTPERPGLTTRYPVAAATIIYAGILAALNSSGYLVPASDTAGLRVVGRAEQTVDNSAGAAGALSCDVKEGVFKFSNSAGDAVDANDVGKTCFVEDDHIVCEAGATHKVQAGRVVAVDSDGVWVDCRSGQAARVPSADTLTALTFSSTVTQAEAGALRNAVLAILQAQGLVK